MASTAKSARNFAASEAITSLASMARALEPGVAPVVQHGAYDSMALRMSCTRVRMAEPKHRLPKDGPMAWRTLRSVVPFMDDPCINNSVDQL